MSPRDSPSPRPSDLVRRYRGAPESMRRALHRAVEQASTHIARRELTRCLARLPPLPAQVPAVGVVPFPAVSQDITREEGDGCIYRIIACDGPRYDLARVSPEVTDTVLDWVRGTWPDLQVDGVHIHFSGPRPGDVWEGRSCELAIMLAVLSWSLGMPVQPQRAVTGRLDAAPGRVAPVLHTDRKTALVQQDLQGELVYPKSHEHDLSELIGQVLEEGWRAALREHANRTPERLAREARHAYSLRRYAKAQALAQRVHRGNTQDIAARARAAWVLGACLLHQGHATEGHAHLREARTLVAAWEDHVDEPPDDLTPEELDAHLVISLLDTGQVSAASQVGLAALSALGEPTRRSSRWRHVALQLAGSTHRALVALGRHNEAADILQHYPLGVAMLRHQRARALGDLAEVHRRAGRRSDAARALRQAQQALGDALDHERESTAQFLRLYAARQHPEEATGEHDLVWPALGLALVAARHANEPQQAMARLATHPMVMRSFPLTWVCIASACPWLPLSTPWLQQALGAWSTDHADLNALAATAAEGDVDAWVALAARCPY